MRLRPQDEHCSLKHTLPPVQIAELAVDRRDHRLGQQIGRHDPRQLLEAAEVTDDGGERRRDDRLIERRQEQRQQQAAEDDEDLPVRQRFIGRGCRERGCRHGAALGKN